MPVRTYRSSNINAPTLSARALVFLICSSTEQLQLPFRQLHAQVQQQL